MDRWLTFTDLEQRFRVTRIVKWTVVQGPGLTTRRIHFAPWRILDSYLVFVLSKAELQSEQTIRPVINDVDSKSIPEELLQCWTLVGPITANKDAV